MSALLQVWDPTDLAPLVAALAEIGIDPIWRIPDGTPDDRLNAALARGGVRLDRQLSTPAVLVAVPVATPAPRAFPCAQRGCPRPGTLSSETHGTGPYWCATHWADRDDD